MAALGQQFLTLRRPPARAPPAADGVLSAHDLEELEQVEGAPTAKQVVRFAINQKGPPLYQLCAATKRRSLMVFSCAPRFEQTQVR